MKRAGTEALDTLEPLLREVRKQQELTERKPGIFYRKAAAVLHFHEDQAGLFADLRQKAGWIRMAVNTRAEHRALLAELAVVLSGGSAGGLRGTK